VGVVDELAVDVPRSVTIGERVGRLKDLRRAAQVEDGRDAVIVQRFATCLSQLTDVVGPDEDMRARDAAAPGDTPKVAGVLAFRPVEMAA
jgi:hypothetical protein